MGGVADILWACRCLLLPIRFRKSGFTKARPLRSLRTAYYGAAVTDPVCQMRVPTTGYRPQPQLVRAAVPLLRPVMRFALRCRP